jgi:Holliday junction resolvasome RuvABC endonuclease subunit
MADAEDNDGPNYQVVLGVDVSLTNTGMAWLESPTGERQTHSIESPHRAGIEDSHLTYGDIPKGSVIPLGIRLDRLCSDVTIAVGDLWQPKPKLAVVESGFSGGKGPSATKLGMASAAVLIALTRMYVPTVLIPPKTRAKFATGNGGADKEAVLEAAVNQFGYETLQGEYPKPKGCSQEQWKLNYDRADALILAFIGAYLIGESFEIPGFYLYPEQEGAIEKLPPWQDTAASDIAIELEPGEEPF